MGSLILQLFYLREESPAPTRYEAGWAPQQPWTLFRVEEPLLLLRIKVSLSYAEPHYILRVKFTIGHAMNAKRRSSITLLFLSPRRQMRVEWLTPRPGRFTPGNDTLPIVQEGRWAGLNVCEKYRLRRDSIPGPSSP